MAPEEGKMQAMRPMSVAAIRKQQRVCAQPVNQSILNRIPVLLDSSS
jgi:hypothetical protein